MNTCCRIINKWIWTYDVMTTRQRQPVVRTCSSRAGGPSTCRASTLRLPEEEDRLRRCWIVKSPRPCRWARWLRTLGAMVSQRSTTNIVTKVTRQVAEQQDVVAVMLVAVGRRSLPFFHVHEELNYGVTCVMIHYNDR